MPTILEVRKTYKYRLYTSKRDVRLHEQIDVAGRIWNHVTRLQKRFYGVFGKHISAGRMQKHISKLRMKTKKYAYWRKLGSQACAPNRPGDDKGRTQPLSIVPRARDSQNTRSWAESLPGPRARLLGGT
jgi:hypothetical protein